MIELIFVIVILGILAAVAIPKLAATRDDAKIAGEMTGIAQTIQNLGAEYTAQGAFNNYTIADAKAAVKCFDFTDNGDGNVTLTATQVDATLCTDAIFAAVKEKATANGVLGANAADKDYIFGGVSIAQ